MERLTERIRLAQQGDERERERLILDNVPLVWSVVRRFAYTGKDGEELFQIGMIGLMQALDRFDVSYDVKLSTYAVPMILGEIRRFLRDDTPVKISRNIMTNRQKIKELQEQGEDLSVDEIAERSGLSREDVVLALGSERPVGSIYEPVYDSGEGEVLLVEQLQEKGKSIEQRVMEKQQVDMALGVLDEQEKKLIHMRFFENLTQAQIGKDLKLSQVQVSRMEKKILRKMRQQLS